MFLSERPVKNPFSINYSGGTDRDMKKTRPF